MGFCIDSAGAALDAISKRMDLLGNTAEGCGAWCLTFRAPGFVGFDMNTDTCWCHYSDGALPDDSNLSDAYRNDGPTGTGQARGNNNAQGTCYPFVGVSLC